MDRAHSSDVETDVEHNGLLKRADIGMTDETEDSRKRDYIDGSDYSDDGEHKPDKFDETGSENEVYPSPQQNLDNWVVREKKQLENGERNRNAKEEAVVQAEKEEVGAADDWGCGSFSKKSKKDKKKEVVEMSIDEVLNIKERERILLVLRASKGIPSTPTRPNFMIFIQFCGVPTQKNATIYYKIAYYKN